jgi:sulfite exporter TauE/SafE
VSATAAAALLLGLMGGAHCAAMCGGIVGALNLRPHGAPRALAVDLPIQLAYNGGRIASYTAAGAIAGGIGGMALLAESLWPAQVALAVAANVVLILAGLHLGGFGALWTRIEAAGAVLWRRIAPLGARFVPADTPPRAFAVGTVWGWLPCGLVYSALALAITAGGPASGAAVMLAFGLGTLPNLLAAGFAAQRMRALLARRGVRRAAGALVAALGVIGLLRVPGVMEQIRAGLLCLT